MKLLAYILSCSLVVFGFNGLMETPDHPLSGVEVALDAGCCAEDHDCEQEEQHPGHDHTCPSGCNCCCCFHLVAIEYQIYESLLELPLIDHFRPIQDSYHYEFATHLFHPPRLG
jgi:hypothetical protein